MTADKIPQKNDLYRLLRERCGLSLDEAAAFHDTRIDTVRSWSSGRRNAPPGAIDELRALYAKIERAASELVDIAKKIEAEAIEISLSSDDHEAQSLGWPCAGAHEAAIGIAAARLSRDVIIVPRGSTPATAAAADAHKK